MSVPNEKNLDLSLLRFRKAPDEASGEALAEALIAASREKDALSIFETLRKLSPREPRFPYRAGKLLLAAGDYPAAQKALVDALRLAPGDAEITLSLGEVLLKRGEPRRAVELLSKHRGESDAIDRLLTRAERFARLSEIGDEFAEASGPPAPSPFHAEGFDAEGFLEDVPTEMLAREELEMLRKPTEPPKIEIEIDEEIFTAEGGADVAAGGHGGADDGSERGARDAAEKKAAPPPPPVAAQPGASPPAPKAALKEAIPLPESNELAGAPTGREGAGTGASGLASSEMPPRPSARDRADSPAVDDAELVRGVPRTEKRAKRRLRFFVASFIFAALAASGAYLARQFYEHEQARERQALRQEITAAILSAEPGEVREALSLSVRLGSIDEMPAELRADLAFGEAVALLDLGERSSDQLRALIPLVEAPLREALAATADYVDTGIAPKSDALPLPSTALDPRASYLFGRLKQIASIDGLADLEAAFRAERGAVRLARVEHALTLFIRGKKREARTILSEKPIDEAPRAAAVASLLGLGEPFQDEIEASSPFDVFLCELARIHAEYRAGRAAEARERILAIPLTESGRGAIEALLLYRVAESTGALERANSALELALERHPEDAALRAEAARLAARRGDLERSSVLVEALPPERTRELRAELAFRAKDAEAIASLVQELEAAEEEPSLIFALRLRHALLARDEVASSRTEGGKGRSGERLDAGAFDAADLEALKESETPLGLYALGLYSLSLGTEDGRAQAIELLESAYESFPNDALLLRELGKALLDAGEATRGRTYLSEASELGDARANLWLIEALPPAGERSADERSELLLRLEALDRSELRPEEAERALRLIAQSAAEREDYTQAHQTLDTLAREHLADVLELRAKLLYREGRYAELIELVEAPLRDLVEGRAGARTELIPLLPLYGEALEAEGEVRRAGPVFEASVKLDPEATIGRLGYARSFIRAGKMWAALKVLERAEETLKAAGLFEKHREEWLFLKGRALLALDRREEAEEPLTEASKIEGVRPEIFFYLGEALAARKSSEARAAYMRYLELEPDGAHRRRAERAIR